MQSISCRLVACGHAAAKQTALFVLVRIASLLCIDLGDMQRVGSGTVKVATIVIAAPLTLVSIASFSLCESSLL